MFIRVYAPSTCSTHTHCYNTHTPHTQHTHNTRHCNSLPQQAPPFRFVCLCLCVCTCSMCLCHFRCVYLSWPMCVFLSMCVSDVVCLCLRPCMCQNLSKKCLCRHVCFSRIFQSITPYRLLAPRTTAQWHGCINMYTSVYIYVYRYTDTCVFICLYAARRFHVAPFSSPAPAHYCTKPCFGILMISIHVPQNFLRGNAERGRGYCFCRWR